MIRLIRLALVISHDLSACLPRKNVTSWKILRYHLVSSSSRSYKFNYDPDTKK